MFEMSHNLPLSLISIPFQSFFVCFFHLFHPKFSHEGVKIPALCKSHQLSSLGEGEGESERGPDAVGHLAQLGHAARTLCLPLEIQSRQEMFDSLPTDRKYRYLR